MDEVSVELHRVKDGLAHLDTRVAVLETKSGHVESKLVLVEDELSQLHRSLDDLKNAMRENHAALRETLVDHVIKEDAGRIKIMRTLIAILLSIIGSVAMALFDIFRNAHGF